MRQKYEETDLCGTMPWIAGVDEAGRGALAGPVVAAAVVLPEGFTHPLLRDSKTLTPTQRALLFHRLMEAGALIGIGMQGPEVIDRLNILRATLLSMEEAIDSLPLSPARIRVDGPHAPRQAGVETYIRGDQTFPEIAAASIVAKIIRDQLMQLLHKDYPLYNWAANKGYPTPTHRLAIKTYGVSPLHRLSFL